MLHMCHSYVAQVSIRYFLFTSKMSYIFLVHDSFYHAQSLLDRNMRAKEKKKKILFKRDHELERAHKET